MWTVSSLLLVSGRPSPVFKGPTQPAGAGGQTAGPAAQGATPGHCGEELLHQSGPRPPTSEGESEVSDRCPSDQWLHFSLLSSPFSSQSCLWIPFSCNTI